MPSANATLRSCAVPLLLLTLLGCSQRADPEPTVSRFTLPILEPIEEAFDVETLNRPGVSAVRYRFRAPFPADEVREELARRVQPGWKRRPEFGAGYPARDKTPAGWVPAWHQEEGEAARWDLYWIAEWDGPGGEYLQVRVRFEIAGVQSILPTGADATDELVVAIELFDAKVAARFAKELGEQVAVSEIEIVDRVTDCAGAAGLDIVVIPAREREDCEGLKLAQIDGATLCFDPSEAILRGAEFCRHAPMVATRSSASGLEQVTMANRVALVLRLTQSGRSSLANWTRAHPRESLVVLLDGGPIAVVELSPGSEHLPMLLEPEAAERLSLGLEAQ